MRMHLEAPLEHRIPLLVKQRHVAHMHTHKQCPGLVVVLVERGDRPVAWQRVPQRRQQALRVEDVEERACLVVWVGAGGHQLQLEVVRVGLDT